MRIFVLAVLAATIGVAPAGAQSERAPMQSQRDAEDDMDPNTIRDCAVCPELKIVPAGSFVMGAPASLLNEVPWERQIDGARVLWETPEKKVVFAKPFAIGAFEVTRFQYGEFVKATDRKTEPGCVVWAGDWDRSANGKSWADAGIPQSDDHPAVCVSKDDAEAYAAWLTEKTGRKYSLPSEAQYEYALRAGGTTRHPWGDNPEDACQYANLADATLKAKHPARASHVCDDGYLYTAPAGLRKGNAFGLYDMVGNAWEWVADCWTPSHDALPGDGSPVTSGFCKESPLRGGAYGTGPMFTRSSSRGGPDKRTTKQSWIGFRVAAEVQKSTR